MNSLLLLATCVRRTVNHYANVVLLIDFISQLLSHHFAYHGNKVIAAFIVCVCCANVKSILLLEGKNCLIFCERHFLFGNKIRSVKLCFHLLSGFVFYSLHSSLQPLRERRVLDWLLLRKESITGREMAATNAMFLQTFFFECVASCKKFCFACQGGKSAKCFTSHFVFILVVNYPVKMFLPLMWKLLVCEGFLLGDFFSIIKTNFFSVFFSIFSG